jgi:NADPH2:quinone reductase
LRLGVPPGRVLDRERVWGSYMQAVVIREFGPPEVLVLREVGDPKLGRGDVMVDVEFANVTFVETQIRRGRPPRPSMLPQLPVILGNGVGGTVVAVGAAVDSALVGASVLATTGGRGGYAERVSVPATSIISIPGELAMSDAVALLADGRTAVGLIDAAVIQPGETVLVEAAAGGVGSRLVQLAKRAGARVIAVAGGERKLEVARALGADVVIDYRRSSWTKEVGSVVRDGGVDVVFDGVGGSIGRDAFRLLARGGRLCAFGMAAGSFAAITEDELSNRGVTRARGAALNAGELAALTARALSTAAAGELRAVIGQKTPLADTADAHRAIETRATIGKTLLIP